MTDAPEVEETEEASIHESLYKTVMKKMNTKNLGSTRDCHLKINLLDGIFEIMDDKTSDFLNTFEKTIKKIAKQKSCFREGFDGLLLEEVWQFRENKNVV